MILKNKLIVKNMSITLPVYHYAILMETSGKHYESWYNFIRYEGNEEELKHLQHNLEKIDFYIL